MHDWGVTDQGVTDGERVTAGVADQEVADGERVSDRGVTDDRPAARVLCLDGAGHVLLMRWRDPVGGGVFWEPPGGGVDPGETPLAAARRELTEETGLPGGAVLDRWVPVRRDFTWLGVRYVKVEPFYLARFDGRPAVRPAALTAEEAGAFLGFDWFSAAELATLPDPVEPPGLIDVLAELTGRSDPADLRKTPFHRQGS